MKNLLNVKAALLTILLASILSLTASAGDFTSASVIGAANKLATLHTDNINISGIDLTDVSSDLESGHLQVLNDVLSRVEGDNILNRLLRRARLIGKKEVVVGVITTSVGEVDHVLVASKKSLRARGVRSEA